MNNLIIRECVYKDLDYIIALQQQWAKEEITYGFVYGTVHKSQNMAVMDNGQFYIEIDDIYVSFENRGFNIGTILLDKILEIAKENGVKRSLIYSSTKDMESIIKFYKKHDYKTWCIQMFM